MAVHLIHTEGEVVSRSLCLCLTPAPQMLHLCSDATPGCASRCAILLHTAPVIPNWRNVASKKWAKVIKEKEETQMLTIVLHKTKVVGVCESHLTALSSSTVSWFRAMCFDSAVNTALPERPWASLNGTCNTITQGYAQMLNVWATVLMNVFSFHRSAAPFSSLCSSTVENTHPLSHKVIGQISSQHVGTEGGFHHTLVDLKHNRNVTTNKIIVFCPLNGWNLERFVFRMHKHVSVFEHTQCHFLFGEQGAKLW